MKRRQQLKKGIVEATSRESVTLISDVRYKRKKIYLKKKRKE
jgi:hypothetical protein